MTDEVLGREYRRVVRRGDGMFYRRGYDCPDYWVHDPMQASQLSLLYLRDEYLKDVPGAVVEIEVTARLTGFTEGHLYKDGEWVDPRAKPKPKEDWE